MMELENDHVEQKRVSVLQGEGYGVTGVLSRESSMGQSSCLLSRTAEGVPFKWELMPGTPKNPQEEDAIPPLSPPPSMQSLGLPLPNIDHNELDQGPPLKLSKIWSFRQKMNESFNHDIIKKVYVLGKKRNKKQKSSRSNYVDYDGDFGASSIKCSSFASCSLFRRDSVDGPFCCSPWNVSTILEDGNTKIYYCRQHKTAYTVEKDGPYLSRTLSRFSGADDHFSGPSQNEISPTGETPFRREMQPGTPKNFTRPENDVIPPTSPPPAVQSSALPRPALRETGPSKDSTWKRAWFFIKGKRTDRVKREISFRYHGMDNGTEIRSSDEEEVSSLSSVSPLSKSRNWRLLKIRSFNGSFCRMWSLDSNRNSCFCSKKF